eukprot:scaffold4502_cov119-Isochrysis_galbana.AAC.8
MTESGTGCAGWRVEGGVGAEGSSPVLSVGTMSKIPDGTARVARRSVERLEVTSDIARDLTERTPKSRALYTLYLDKVPKISLGWGAH